MAGRDFSSFWSFDAFVGDGGSWNSDSVWSATWGLNRTRYVSFGFLGVGGEDGAANLWLAGVAVVSSLGSQGPLSLNVDDEGLGFIWPKFRSIFWSGMGLAVVGPCVD